jgi:hypothetical protein
MQDQWSSADEQFLICEFDLDGEQRSGSLHEFGISELVVDTDVALSTGSEIEVRLIRSPALPEIWLEVSVAEELALPAGLSDAAPISAADSEPLARVPGCSGRKY